MGRPPALPRGAAAEIREALVAAGPERVFGVEFHGRGAQIRARCPFHGGRNLSLRVNASTLAWVCGSKCGDAGGGPLEAIAIRAAILEPGGSLRGEALERALEAARGVLGMPSAAAPLPPAPRAAPRGRDANGESAGPRDAQGLWAAAAAGEGTPAQSRLVGRGVLEGDAPVPLRWLTPAASRMAPAAARWLPRLPDGAAGWMVAPLVDRAGSIAALELEPLSADGAHVGFAGGGKRRTIGPSGGLAFHVAGPAPSGPLAICEGVADALALARYAPVAAARAAHGLSGWVMAAHGPRGWSDWRRPRPVLLVPDGDAAAQRAARKAARDMRPYALRAHVATLPPGADPAALGPAILEHVPDVHGRHGRTFPQGRAKRPRCEACGEPCRPGGPHGAGGWACTCGRYLCAWCRVAHRFPPPPYAAGDLSGWGECPETGSVNAPAIETERP